VKPPGAWSFHNPVEIHFGPLFPRGLASHLATGPTLYVTSSGSTRRGHTAQVLAQFQELKIEHRVLESETSNPSFIDLEAAAARMIGFQPKQVIALGGGSVLDLAKMLSYVLAPGAPALPQLFETLRAGGSAPLLDPLPMIAVPTTAGTGSEVTPFATLWESRTKKKYSLANARLHPRKALLDPQLTLSLPWTQTLATGIDALSQAIESVWNRNYTPLTGALAARALRLIWTSLPRLKTKLDDLEARSGMMEASLLAGLCISRTRTALAHSISYPLTAHFGTSHGLACGFTLPELWTYNYEADDGRMRELLVNAGFAPARFGEELVGWMRQLDFGPSFMAELPATLAQVLALENEMFTPGRADNNLRSPANGDLRGIVERSMVIWSSRRV
jgi:phosphonate metabolism-associated iron-containing alcohol dehydrogenase